jgi:hypothetical protein
MKPKVKPPGTKHLKLEHERLLPNFAFHSNLRRYIKGGEKIEYEKRNTKRARAPDANAAAADAPAARSSAGAAASAAEREATATKAATDKVGRCRLTQ